MKRVEESAASNRGETKKYRIPVFDTLRLAGEIFKGQWWKLALLAAIPQALLWLLVVLPIPHYPRMPYLNYFFVEPGLFLQKFLIALPFDLAWVLIYSWLDCGKTLIVYRATEGANAGLREIFAPKWRVLGRIVLIRIAVGLTQQTVASINRFAWLHLSSALRIFLTAGLFLTVFSVAVLLVLVPFKIVVEKRGFGQAIQQSFRRVQPGFWRVFIIVALAGTPYLISRGIIWLPLWRLFPISASSLSVYDYSMDLFSSLSEIITYAFGWSALGALYVKSRTPRRSRTKPLEDTKPGSPD